MRKLVLLLIACLPLISIAQDNAFKLVFIPGEYAGKASAYYLDYYNGKLVRDSAKLKNGAVTFAGKADQPRTARIRLLVPHTDGRMRVESVDVILEPGNIKVDASKGVDAIQYSGTRTQQEYSQWNAGVAPILKEMKKSWMELFNYRKNKDKENEIKAQEAINDIKTRLASFQENFMLNHKSSVVTALMLKEYVTPVWENLAVAKKVYDGLDPKLKNLPDVKQFGKELDIALTVAPGKQYPDFTLPDSAGRMVSLASFKGKYVLVDFWASWCGPCRQESPALVSAYQKYRPKGFEILGVSFDQGQPEWLEAVAADKYTWTNVVDTTGMGPEGKISGRFNIMAIPRNFLLDKEGNIIATNLRGDDLERKLREIFKEG